MDMGPEGGCFEVISRLLFGVVMMIGMLIVLLT